MRFDVALIAAIQTAAVPCDNQLDIMRQMGPLKQSAPAKITVRADMQARFRLAEELQAKVTWLSPRMNI